MASSRRGLRWLIGLGALFGCVVLAAAAAPFLIPVDRYRPLLEQLLSSATGREVTTAGLRLELWPRVHVRVLQVRLRNPQGFPSGDAASVQSVDLGVEPRALLRRQLEITYVAVDGVRVDLLTDVHGRTNLDPPPMRRRTPPRAPGEGRPLLRLDPIGAVTVSHVDLTVGGLDAGRRETTPVLQVTGLGATIRSIDPAASNWAKTLEVAANLRGAQIVTPLLTAPVRILSGELVLHRGQGNATFVLELGTLRATGRVSITGANPAPVVFALAIPELDAERLQRVVNPSGRIQPPSAGGPQRLLARGRIDLEKVVAPPITATRVRSRVSVYSDHAVVDAFSFAAFGGAVDGTAEARYGTPSFPAAATAHARGVNLEALLRAFRPAGPKITGALDADFRLATAFAPDPRAAMAGRGAFLVRNLELAPVAASQVSGQLSLDGHRIAVPSYVVSAYGGTVTGAAALDYAAPPMPADATARVRGINLDALMRAVAAGSPRVTGTLDADLRLASTLGQDAEAALTGAGTFGVRDGSFPGLDLKSNLVAFAKLLQVGVPAGPTRFRYFGGDVRIAQERAFNNALRLDADGLQATARGSCGFNKTLDYRGTGTLSLSSAGTSTPFGALPSVADVLGRYVPGAAGATAARTPFTLRGTVDAPQLAAAGAPEFIRGQGPDRQPPPQAPQAPQIPPLPPALRDLLKLPR